nr:hypothetical protein [uncultured Roseococcus sp.]
MTGVDGQAQQPGSSCRVRVNLSFGTDLTPCEGLRARIAAGKARIGTFDDLRLGQTSRMLVMDSPEGPLLAALCPACGAQLAAGASRSGK